MPLKAKLCYHTNNKGAGGARGNYVLIFFRNFNLFKAKQKKTRALDSNLQLSALLCKWYSSFIASNAMVIPT